MNMSVLFHGWIRPETAFTARKFPFDRWTVLLLNLWTRLVTVIDRVPSLVDCFRASVG